jgi:hypothetical protein
MRKNALLLAALCMLSISSVSHASLSVGSKIHLQDGLGNNIGGQFVITDAGSNPGQVVSTFNTYCIQLSEQITPSATAVYTVAGLSNHTEVAAPTGYLTDFVAWLYTGFLNNNPAITAALGANPATNVAASNAVQYSIWKKTYGTVANGYPDYTAQYNALTSAFNTAVSNSQWTAGSLGSVVIMNLVNANGANVQDQLAVVPEASTIAVWSVLSLVGAGVAYRKRMAKA